MTLSEWNALYEFNSPNKHAGNLTDEDVQSLLDDDDLTDEEWWDKYGAASR